MTEPLTGKPSRRMRDGQPAVESELALCLQSQARSAAICSPSDPAAPKLSLHLFLQNSARTFTVVQEKPRTAAALTCFIAASSAIYWGSKDAMELRFTHLCPEPGRCLR